ncbi:hypothetical protein FPOA_08333 [Fusarium poae]|uniref:Uncharacterized protein n=1 Tax=Fusarium poae TaxID=36050 RepID=A0A1B8ANS6_FUSPO|nr:hypothetical protein FPOA_08333 [Fusarium poae]
MERQFDRLSAGAELCFLSLPTQDRTLNSNISPGVKVSAIQYKSTHPLSPRCYTEGAVRQPHLFYTVPQYDYNHSVLSWLYPWHNLQTSSLAKEKTAPGLRVELTKHDDAYHDAETNVSASTKRARRIFCACESCLKDKRERVTTTTIDLILNGL